MIRVTFAWMVGLLLLSLGSLSLKASPQNTPYSSGTKPKTILVGYNEDFPPYFYEEVSKNKKNVTGIFPEMVQLAAQKLGVLVKFERFPWKRLLDRAKEKKVDAIMTLFRNTEREEYLFYPDTGIAIAEVSFFTHPDLAVKYSGELYDLKPFTIGMVEGYDNGNEFKEAGFLVKEPCLSDESLVEKFKQGRFPVGISAKRVIQYYARRANIPEGQIRFLDPPLLRKPLYLAFSKKVGYDQLAKKFSWALRQLRQEGKHLEILTKYHCEEDFIFFKELVIGIDQEDYPPYCYWDGENAKGVGPDLIKMAADAMGIDIRFKKICWQEFVPMAAKGKIDAITPVFKTEKREASFFYPSSGILSERNYFFALKENKGITYTGDLKTLQGIPLGAVKDYAYGKSFDTVKNLAVTRFDSIKDLIQQLMNKKVQVIVGDKSVMGYFAQKAGVWDKIKLLGPSLPSEFLYLAFSKRNSGFQKITQSFSDAFRELVKNGIYRKILRDHGIEKRTITLAADNWQPYYGENLENDGPIAQIITEAFKRVDYGVVIDFMPRTTMLDKISNGPYDAGFAVSYSDQLAKSYYYSNRINIGLPYVLYKRKDTTIIYNGQLSDLQNYRIGVVRGFWYGETFDNFKGLQKVEANSADVNVQQLLKNRLDLMVIDPQHGQYLLDRIPLKEKERLESLSLYPRGKETKLELFLVISRNAKDAEQIKIDFNYGLEQISKDGTKNSILAKQGAKNGTSNSTPR